MAEGVCTNDNSVTRVSDWPGADKLRINVKAWLTGQVNINNNHFSSDPLHKSILSGNIRLL